MRWFRLQKMVLNDFRSFAGRHEVEFSPGLDLVDGLNVETKVRSGVGKTNLLLAVAYLLDFCPIPMKSLQSRGGSGSTYVEGHFESDRGPLVVRRGAGASLAGCGEDVRGADAVLQAMDRTFGVPAKLRRALTYRPQKGGAPFVSMPDSEKKRFLVELIPGTAELEVAVKGAAGVVDGVQAVVTKARAAHDAQKAVLDSLPIPVEEQPLPEDYGRVTRALDDEVAARARVESEREKRARLEFESEQRVRAARDNVGRLVKAARERVGSLAPDPMVVQFEEVRDVVRGDLARAETVDGQRRAAWEVSLQEERRALSRVGAPLRDLPVLRSDLGRTRKELATLDKGKCPTCSQMWDKSLQHYFELSGRESSLVDQVKSLESLEVEVATAEAHLALREYAPDPEVARLRGVLTQVEARLESARLRRAREEGEARAPAESQVAVLEAEFAKFQAEEAMKVAGDRELAEASQRLHEASQELKAAQMELGVARAANQSAAVLAKRAAESRRTAEEKLEQARLALVDAELTLAAEQDYRDLVKAFLDRVFDEVLAEVSEEANRMLGRFPNTAHLSVRFDPERENSKGEVKNRITPKAWFDGEERPLEHEASGGQMTSVELAVDLAVAAVAARHSGVNLQWLLLDESFNGHCQVTKESCLEILKAFAEEGRLVLVVDHADSFKAMFDRVIEVEYSGGKSKIKEAT